jgi:hypothetical protein
MSSVITEQNLFRPAPSRAETKSDITDKTARALIEAEADSRDAKTARLRLARLAMEALQPAIAPAKPRAKAASKPRRRST